LTQTLSFGDSKLNVVLTQPISSALAEQEAAKSTNAAKSNLMSDLHQHDAFDCCIRIKVMAPLRTCRWHELAAMWRDIWPADRYRKDRRRSAGRPTRAGAAWLVRRGDANSVQPANPDQTIRQVRLSRKWRRRLHARCLTQPPYEGRWHRRGGQLYLPQARS